MDKSLEAELNKTNAMAMFGEYFQVWHFLEYEVSRCIEKALGLTELQRTAVFTHILWRDRIDILRNVLSLLSMPKEKLEEHSKRLVKVAKLAGTRNMAAHNAFFADDDGSLVFYRRKAKGKVEMPQTRWTRKSVDQMLEKLWREIKYLQTLREELPKIKNTTDVVNALLHGPPYRNALAGLSSGTVQFPPEGHEQKGGLLASFQTDPEEPDA